MGSRHGRNPYLFTLKTNDQTLYCGERDDFDDNGAIIPASPKSGKGTRIAISWADEIKSAYQPVSVTKEDTMMIRAKQKEEIVEENTEEAFEEANEKVS